MQDTNKIPNSVKELRALYQVSRPTWNKWLLPIKDKIRMYAKVYTPHELHEIITLLGAP